jgi:hypothetical protein
MEQQPKSSDDGSARPRSAKAKRARKIGKKAWRLTAREYLPMVLLIAFWAVAAIGIGHADAARLLAATVLMRAPLMLSQMTTLGPLRRRAGASNAVLGQSRRTAWLVQLAVLAALMVETGLLYAGLIAAGQRLVGETLVVLALGYPAKLYRGLDLKASAQLFPSIATVAAVIGAGAAWAAGMGAVGFALAYALREYVAILCVRLFGRSKATRNERRSDEPLTFAEIARNSVVTSRRRLTYRLTKNILTIFGPFGNLAARTGRGLNLHSKLEPYMPHRRGGFVLFALFAAVLAVGLVVHSGKPVAMIAAAGALQLAALALNVLIWWRYLPKRDDGSIVVDDDDDD